MASALVSLNFLPFVNGVLVLSFLKLNEMMMMMIINLIYLTIV